MKVIRNRSKEFTRSFKTINEIKRTGSRKGVLIQGGSYRIDKPPSQNEIDSFRFATVLHEVLKDDKKTLGCIVNDLGLPPKERPKNQYIDDIPLEDVLPEEYIKILVSCKEDPEIVIFWESHLRNLAAMGPDNAFKMNKNTGFPVPTCASIMGAFYRHVEVLGYPEIIAVYPVQDACGPVNGKDMVVSGYRITIPVTNLFTNNGKLFDEDKVIEYLSTVRINGSSKYAIE